MTKKITMETLAKLANVDVSTVSRALNDSPLVKAGTKEHILKLAQETGYVVNASARNLRRQSSEAIGIVIPLNPASGQTISDPFFLEMVGAVSHAASQRGYDLIVSIPQHEDSVAEQRLLQTGKADGLIVIGQAGRIDRLNALAEHTNKFVVWGGQVENIQYTLVGSDNLKGGMLGVEHLFSIGRRRILFLGDIQLPEVALRYQGVRQAYENEGLEHDRQLILSAGFAGDTAYDAIREYIVSGDPFDAVFAASDVLAMAAIHALNSRGVKIPDDVSVVGYDNIGSSALCTPSLTTIDQNITLGGEIMVDMLLQKIRGENIPSQLTPTNLIVRNSSVM